MPEISSNLPTLYTAEDVAKAFGLKSTHWLEEAARRNRIPHTRIGRCLRFTRHQIDLAIQLYTVEQQTTKPAEARTLPPVTGNDRKPSRLRSRVPARMRNAAKLVEG
jgi:hypothetical protein